MPVEIERKFLVTGDAWRNGNPPSQRQAQLLCVISKRGLALHQLEWLPAAIHT